MHARRTDHKSDSAPRQSLTTQQLIEQRLREPDRRDEAMRIARLAPWDEITGATAQVDDDDRDHGSWELVIIVSRRAVPFLLWVVCGLPSPRMFSNLI